MPSKQGSLDLLNHPVAQRMLQAPFPTRIAYVWTDGTPRVVPIGFHWDGRQIVMASPPDAPKIKALKQNPRVALTIDDNTYPHDVLLLRGAVEISEVNGIVPEYALMCERCLGKATADEWLVEYERICPRQVRLAVTPDWVGIIDFRERNPSGLEKAREKME